MSYFPKIYCGCPNTDPWWPWPSEVVHEGEIAQTFGYDLEHDCEKVTVYRKRAGLRKRIYVLKKKP